MSGADRCPDSRMLPLAIGLSFSILVVLVFVPLSFVFLVSEFSLIHHNLTFLGPAMLGNAGGRAPAMTCSGDGQWLASWLTRRWCGGQTANVKQALH